MDNPFQGASFVQSLFKVVPGGFSVCCRWYPNSENVIDIAAVVEQLGVEFGENPCVLIVPIGDGGV